MSEQNTLRVMMSVAPHESRYVRNSAFLSAMFGANEWGKKEKKNSQSVKRSDNVRTKKKNPFHNENNEASEKTRAV